MAVGQTLFIIFMMYAANSRLSLADCFEEDVGYPHNDIGSPTQADSPEDCQIDCQNSNECQFWTYNPSSVTKSKQPECYLKTSKGSPESRTGVTSGPKYCSKLGPLCLDIHDGCEEVKKEYEGLCSDSRAETLCRKTCNYCDSPCYDIAVYICDVDKCSTYGNDYKSICQKTCGLCSGNKRCPPSMFQCDNSLCVWKNRLCDSKDDCGDNSDESETNCAHSKVTDQCMAWSQCRDNEWQCKSGNQCILKSYRCDKENDCQDQSDEIGCDSAKEPEKRPLAECPSDFVRIGNGCYHFNLPSSEGRTTPAKAAAACTSLSSTLLALETEDEWEHMKSYLNSHSVGDHHYWIGYKKTSGEWAWPNGTPLKYEPVWWPAFGSDPDCAAILNRGVDRQGMDRSFNWRKFSCTHWHSAIGYICEQMSWVLQTNSEGKSVYMG